MRRFDGKRNRKKRGIALLIVIGLVLVLAILAWVILSLGGGHYYSTASQIKRVKAYYLAEGGVQRALWEIRIGNLAPIPIPGTPTDIYHDVDNDPGTQRTGGGPGEETLVRVHHIADYPAALPAPPAGVIYYIESMVDPGDIPAE